MGDSKDDVATEILEVVSDLVIEQTRTYIRIAMDAADKPLDFKLFGSSLLHIYVEAVKQEAGETAAPEFAKGVVGRLAN